MLYLLDANVLIDAQRKYYSHDQVPEFWEWLIHHGEDDNTKIAIEIYEEITEKNKKKEDKDALSLWAEKTIVEKALMFSESVNVNLVRQVTDHGYAANLTDDEIDKVGRDPFLISYALAEPNSRCIVTTEVRKPNKIRANRRIPDVCDTLGITVCDAFDFARALKFRTNWKK